MRLVVDTSVIFKWFVAYGESGLDEAGELLRSHRNGEASLIAPATAPVEVANLLRYVGIDARSAADILDDFERTHVVLVEGTQARLRAAIECAFENRISVYDAMFLSLAQEFECPLVTADRQAFGQLAPDVAQVRLIL